MVSVMEFMMEHIPNMILQWDEEGNMIYSNCLWRDFTGHTDNSSLWTHYVHSDDYANWSQWGNSDGPYFTECRIQRKSDGNFIWHKVQSYLVEDGATNKKTHIRIATDIHNEKLIAIQLNEYRAREDVYRQLLASSCDPIVTFDSLSGMVVNLNRAAEREFQYPLVELVGRSFNVLVPKSFGSNGAVGRLAKCLKNSIHGSLVTMGGSEPVQVVCRDGELVPVILSVTQFVIDSQMLCVATMTVATKALNHQEELRNSKDSFLRTMSHELRTPLFGLLGTLSSILEDSPSISESTSTEEGLDLIRNESSSTIPRSPHSPPCVPTNILLELGLRIDSIAQEISPLDKFNRANKSHKNDAELRQMETCTRSLLSVVNNMIAHYKIEMGLEPIQMPVQFRTLLQEVCGYYESCVAEGVVFTYEVSDAVPLTVISDATLLRHALANLISNALRFTPKGAVAVVVDVVEPSPSLEEVLLWISVADTGIGIAPEFFSQVFQPFTQMDTSNSRKYGGAGLGLAVCKRVVDLLGGSISFNSGLGLGTVFEISLPVSLPTSDLSYPQEEGLIEERAIHFDPLALRPSSPLHTPTSSPRPPISSSLTTSYSSSSLSSSPSSSFYNSSPSSSFYITSPSSSFYNPSPLTASTSTSASNLTCIPTPITVAYQQHSQPPSPEINNQQSTENDRRSFRNNNNNNKYQSALSTIMESDSEVNLECEESTKGMASLVLSRSIPTPDPQSPLEDYSLSPISSYNMLPLQQEPVFTRKSSASAPASPRVPIIHSSPISSTSRFLRRPSFPFVLDDPSLSLMMNPSPTLSSPSSIVSSPISSPRSNVQSPVSPPNHSSSTIVFPLHMRVLVVDDNLVNQNVLKKMLKHMECIVSTAQHGKEALDILFDSACPKYVGYNNFDLILMDCQMPVMDGLQAIKAIRNWETEKLCKNKIRIISLSASGSSETEKQCYESGGDGFISKPVTLQGLSRVLSDRTLLPITLT